MKTIVVLMDSLNRHMLTTYNEKSWVKTPHINEFATDSVVFENHFIGSMACMPARHDIFTGRLNFLERRWGPLEPYDITLQQILKQHDVCTHMITDHTHYVEIGGENYLQQFKTWDIHRGQEFDQWISLVDAPTLPEEYFGKASVQYECNRTRFFSDCDYSTPRTFKAACEWAEENAGADNFFLMVEGFDPHEPFDTPNEFLAMYNDTYDGPEFEWSTYDAVTEPPEAVEHLNKKYAATLSMADKWFGKFMRTLKENELYDDTLIIFTTDHGHMLGEHGFTGKNYMHAYNEMAHIPLMIHMPSGEYKGERRKALTQNIDLMPTILSFFNLSIPETVMGYNLLDIVMNKKEKVREAALYGWHGRPVNVTDGQYTYFRTAANEDNQPCYNYCAIPTTLWRYLGIDQEESIETGRFIPRTKYPVYKIPEKDARGKYVSENLLFNIIEDKHQQNPLKNRDIEAHMLQLLIKLMKETESPQEQYERLGILEVE